MPKKNRKKYNKSKSQTKQNRKRKKLKPVSYDKWWISSFIIVAFISIITYFYLNNRSIGILSLGSFTQPKSPAKKQQIEKLADAIKKLQSNKIEELVFEYNYDFTITNDITNTNQQLIYPKLHSSISQFFQHWSEKINDNQYTLRQNILKLLIIQTNIHDSTELCLCNQAIYYRLIDPLQLILSYMSAASINECFSHKSELTNDTIFHQVAKSKAASLARLILKLGYNNPKLQLSATRLYINIPNMYSNNKNNHGNSIVWQTDIKQMHSQIDIEIVMSAAKNAQLNTDWFAAQNSENYTGYDYWILNHGIHKQFKILTDINARDLQRYARKYSDVAVSVPVQHCNFNKEILFDNSCSPHIIYNWKDFDIYWKEQRPVIIKNGLLNTNDVTFHSLIENFGDLSVMVAEIPYATLFGKKAWSIPIKEYMNVIMGANHNANLYAFDKTLITSNWNFQNFFNFSIPYMRDNEIRNGYNKTYQLALGPMNSGSPPHWHQPAFNGLFQGKKMWWMFSPKNSMYSSMNIMHWVKNEYKQMIKNGEIHKHYCFIQDPGDIVFVPSEWSHAVNNIQPSLAVAIEYDI
eukprot:191481_1